MSSPAKIVSVIIRTKDRLPFLHQAITSVCQQHYRPIELVVVNDGGADVTECVQSILADAPDVQQQLVQNDISVGRAQAANMGLDTATGDFCIFLDDDDYFDPEHIASLVAAHQSQAQPEQLLAVHNSARAVQVVDQSERMLSITGQALDDGQLYYQNCLPILTVLFPTQLRTLGVHFDPDFDLFEDWDFWLQAMQHCEFHFVDRPLCAYRIHDQASGVRDQAKQRLAYQQIYQKWLSTLDLSTLSALVSDSHRWHEQRISQIQSANTVELDRIGQLHDAAIATIQQKDRDIAHLDRLKNDFEQELIQLRQQNEALHRSIQQLQSDIVRVKKTSPYYLAKSGLKYVKNHYPSLFQKRTEEFMQQPIDVIVPVYKGLQDIIDCLDSIQRSSNQQPYELILIDDCSPEPEVSQLLKERAAQGEYTLLINEQNLGFVATVNRGMQLHPDRDVLLLNSDTLVANDWLDRITQAAYRDERIGTVTPASNNATICSYPDFCQDNALSAHTPLTTLDQLFAAANAGRSVDVPTGVGFCMYIRRECLNELGYFDVETFGKGYGEENDFCQRAIKAGWKNRFALDTFVQHTGNVSFGDEHNELKHAALGKLLKRHPQYDGDVQKHIADDPAKPARVRTWLASLRFSQQPITIHVCHNRGGGTMRFVEELSQSIANQSHSLVLMPSIKKPGFLSLNRLHANKDGLAQEESEYALYFDIQNQRELLEDVLTQLPLAGFHFHHMIGLPDWVMSLPKALQQPWLVTLHDYYYIDESISLTDNGGQYIGDKPFQTQSGWIEKFRPLLNDAVACLAPSKACRTLHEAHFPAANIVTQYHEDGQYLQHANFKVAGIKPDSKPLKVAVIGALSKIKGADLLEQAAQLCAKQGIEIEFELIGYGYRSLLKKPHANLTVTGRYHEHELVDSLRQRHADGELDFVWFTALWPETYSYTLSAVIAAELPVLAPDIGAFPERLFGRSQSWIYPWQSSAEQVVALMSMIARADEHTESLAEHISQIAPDSQAMVYREEYLQTLRQEHPTVISQALDESELLRWLSQLQPLTSTELSKEQILRRKALHLLVTIKQAPLMRAVTKAIPLSLQRKVRNVLMR